jgi:GntR family transcriptional regulator
MITIDKESKRPVHEQLVEQLRYLIASGHFQVEQTLPSTRTLGKQVGVSFHTVRKAYQQLQEEGLLDARVGSGFTVVERTPLAKSERMERGATLVETALQQMIGLGLSDDEVDYLFQEQLSLIRGERVRHKLVFAAPYRELAVQCAEQISMAIQQPLEPATFAELERHQDADFVFTPAPNLRRVLECLPRVDALGVVTYLNPEALDRIARFQGQETLGLITRYADAIPPLMEAVRASTGSSGQILAASVEEDAKHLKAILSQTDLVAYSPLSRRRLLPYLQGSQPHIVLSSMISRESMAAIRQVVPT